MQNMASPRARHLIVLEREARYTIKYPRMACRYPWAELDSNIERLATQTLLDVTPRENHSWRSRAEFVKACSKTMGVLALSGGESDLAAVVKAATEGMRLH